MGLKEHIDIWRWTNVLFSCAVDICWRVNINWNYWNDFDHFNCDCLVMTVVILSGLSMWLTCPFLLMTRGLSVCVIAVIQTSVKKSKPGQFVVASCVSKVEVCLCMCRAFGQCMIITELCHIVQASRSAPCSHQVMGGLSGVTHCVSTQWRSAGPVSSLWGQALTACCRVEMNRIHPGRWLMNMQNAYSSCILIQNKQQSLNILK